MISNERLLSFFETQFNGKYEIADAATTDILTLHIDRANVMPVLEALFNDDELRFRFLTDLCGVHYPEQSGKELCVVYHLHSLETNTRLRLKTFFPIDDPVCPSATPLFNTANWMERETFDFYGINFVGHPNLVRILNMDDMDYFPMRKEYTLEDPTRRDKVDAMFGR